MHEGEDCAVIWDMDGTMVDTAELHFKAWDSVCRELSRPFTRADFAATFGRRNPEIIRVLFGDRFDARQADALGDRKEELYREAARGGVEPLPGVRTLLADLDAAGFRQAVGSSAPHANLDLILELTETRAYFGTVVGSEDTQRGKPDPQVFQVAAARLGVDGERCVVLEDAVAGVEAAKAGGMKCVAVTFVGNHTEAALRGAGADLVVRTLEEVSAQTLRQLLS